MTKPEQLVLDLPSRAALGREDFFEAPSNAMALSALDAWPNWEFGKLALCGPVSSGKSHLVQVWASRSGGIVLDAANIANYDFERFDQAKAVAIEDIDTLADMPGKAKDRAEERLFHLHNSILGKGGTLLVTGVNAPSRWNIRLPDLVSRLAAANVAKLEAPDDMLLSAVMVKQFADRQINVSPDLITYLIPRIDRSFAEVKAVVERLDRAGLSKKRAITPRLAGEVLRESDNLQ